eukprot:8428447-Pyramimonas_sp.AAC.1
MPCGDDDGAQRFWPLAVIRSLWREPAWGAAAGAAAGGDQHSGCLVAMAQARDSGSARFLGH